MVTSIPVGLESFLAGVSNDYLRNIREHSLHPARDAFYYPSTHCGRNKHNGSVPKGWRQCRLGQDSGEYTSPAPLDKYPLDIQSTYIDSEKALEAGCAGHLSKPIDIHSFVDTMEKLVAESQTT